MSQQHQQPPQLQRPGPTLDEAAKVLNASKLSPQPAALQQQHQPPVLQKQQLQRGPAQNSNNNQTGNNNRNHQPRTVMKRQQPPPSSAFVGGMALLPPGDNVVPKIDMTQMFTVPPPPLPNPGGKPAHTDPDDFNRLERKLYFI